MFEGDEDIWWVTGGYYNANELLKSTEVFSVQSNSFSFGLDLLTKNAYHNLVNINSTHMVLVGGQYSRVYIIDR